jgi:hypothetical protein
MKVTFERWCIIALLGCLGLGVAILPADGSRTFVAWLTTRENSRLDLWQTRRNARGNRMRSLAAAYGAAEDLAVATHEFGTHPATIGEPDVRFASDVPAPMRSAVIKALNDERAERGEWKGRGKVGVIVRLDTVTRVDGHVISRLDRKASNQTLSRVVAPSAATGGRCVVVIDIFTGDPWVKMYEGKPLGPVHPLLDACGFYDAFGTPGAEISRDMAEDQHFYARGYGWIVAPRDTAKHPRNYSFQRWSSATREVRCLAGDDNACLDELRGKPEEGYASWWYGYVTTPDGVSTTRAVRRDLPYPSAMNRVALELGPQRFARVWQSPKTLEQAYFDETGRTLGQFVRAQDQHEDGVYVPGAWTSWFSMGLTVLAIGLGLGLTMRFAPRARVA